MPCSEFHSYMTRSALSLPPFDTGDNSELIRNYCNWPDFYFSSPEELEPYMFFTDGIQFHYIPDTPYNELYRYWGVSPQKGLHRVKPFRNENFIHAEAGFTYYLSRTAKLFKKQEFEEGKKFLGSLLHMLQDAAFGMHALEGAGGADLFFLNRIMDTENLPLDILSGLPCLELAPSPYTPRILGNSVAEAVMRLYSEYCRRTADSRKCCFEFIMNNGNTAPAQRMFDNAVRLCADVTATVHHLAAGEKVSGLSCKLTDLEPFAFPFGGFRSYRFRSFTRDTACGAEGKAMPLAIGDEEFASGLAFGSHHYGELIYRIAPGVFSKFDCTIGFHRESGRAPAMDFELLNDGKTVFASRIDENNPSCRLHMDAPKGDFGLRFRSSPACGIIVIGEPEFELS